MDVQEGTTVEAVERRGGELILQVVQARAGDQRREVAADLVVHAVGRVPVAADVGVAIATAPNLTQRGRRRSSRCVGAAS
jgi:hypothetical protein